MNINSNDKFQIKTYSYKTYPRRIIRDPTSSTLCFSDEFYKFLHEKGDILPKPFRTTNSYICSLDHDALSQDQRVIDAIIEFGLEQATNGFSTRTLVIEDIPAFYGYEIYEDGNECSYINLLFPWKELAIALLENREDDPLLMGVRCGDIIPHSK